jgi:hypothetical protein
MRDCAGRQIRAPSRCCRSAASSAYTGVPGTDRPCVERARQAIKISLRHKETATGKISRETAYAVTSLTSAVSSARAKPASFANTGPSRHTTTSGT